MLNKALKLIKTLVKHPYFILVIISTGVFITLLGTTIVLISGLGLISVIISFGLFLIFLVSCLVSNYE